MTLVVEERSEDADCCSPKMPQIHQLMLNALRGGSLSGPSVFEDVEPTQNSSSVFNFTSPSEIEQNANAGFCVLPPVHANTARDQSQRKAIIEEGGSQTARVRFAPPSKERTLINSARPSRVLSVASSSSFYEATVLEQKRLETTRCFKVLKGWQQAVGTGYLKNLLIDVHEVLFEAIYRHPEDRVDAEAALSDDVRLFDPPVENTSTSTEEKSSSEYFSLVAVVQNKVKLQQEERKILSTQLAMEHSLQQELSTQLRQLESELEQLNMRYAYNRAEIEGERRALQHLEKEYASLTEQEADLQRDCEVMEFQLDTQQAQLKELRSQQLYLDFVSSAPLKRHMEEKKWQEQHATVALKVQNVEAENRALEDEIKKIDKKSARLEAQYVQDVQSKQQSETALMEIQATFEQFQGSFERTRMCYTPRPDWDSIVDETPELSVQKYQWEISETLREHEAALSPDEDATSKDNCGVLESLAGDNKMVGADDAANEAKLHTNCRGQTKTLVKEMLHWIERLQKHCGVNLHLSRIWHDVEEARVQLNLLHHQLDRSVRKNSAFPITIPNATGVITIAAASPGSAGSPSKSRQDYIMALGMHEGIPLFLRHRGKLKRRVLKKVDVEKMVRKVWVEKRKREHRNPLGRFPLEQVLYEKLYRKYGFQPLIAEWGYNLLMSLQMFSWDSEIEMFLLCLTGAVSDLVYVDQEQMLQGCQQLLLGLSEMYNVESFVSERRVLLKDALVALRTYFPLKTSGQLQAIEQAIIRDMHKMKRGGNDSILYVEDILPLDVKYPLGFFVKTIRTQHFKEIQDYYALLLSELEQRDTNLRGILPLSAVRDAILTIDPLTEHAAVYNVIMKALHVRTRAHLYMREPIHYRAVLRKMNATCLMKFTLNYDPHAEINWRRRQSSLYNKNTKASTENGQNTKPA